MRATPAALVAHMAGSVTTLAYLIKLTRTDGVVLAVTDNDQAIVYGGTTYVSTVGINASAIQTTASLSVDNLEANGFLSAMGINDADIATGLWDYCDARVYRVNYADLSMGDEKLARGWLGEISTARIEVKTEIRSLTQKLQSRLGEIVTPHCKADTFDARCKLVAIEGTWKFSGVAVSTVVAAQRQFTASALTQAVDFFTAGKVVWTAGLNAGLSKEIKTHAASGNILLQEPMPYAVSVADTFVIFVGDRKRYAEDCLGKFNNAINFRGFPFLPGDDLLMRGPQ